VKLSDRRRPSLPPRSAFAGFRFPPDVIMVAVRLYLRYNLSYRDVEELLLERGVEADHVTVFRWVQRFTPLLADAARFCRHAPGDRWFTDETYVKVNDVWRYVYRAVDQDGQVIDVLVSARRDAAAARQFFRRAMATLKVRPTEVVTDAAPVYPAVLDELVPWAWHHVERHATTGSRPTIFSSSTGSDRCAVTDRPDSTDDHRRARLYTERSPRTLRIRIRRRSARPWARRWRGGRGTPNRRCGVRRPKLSALSSEHSNRPDRRPPHRFAVADNLLGRTGKRRRHDTADHPATPEPAAC